MVAFDAKERDVDTGRFGFCGGAHADSAASAIGVEQDVAGLEVHAVDSKLVQHFRLFRICLIKRRGRNLKRARQQAVAHAGTAGEDVRFSAQNGVGHLGIDVLSHGGDAFVDILERGNELPIMRHTALAGDDGEHHLVGVISHADDGIAQKAAALVFLISGNMASFCGACNAIEDGASAGGFDAAIGNANDAMGAAGKEARSNMIFTSGRKGRCRLVAKTAWRSNLSGVPCIGSHAAHGFDRTI